ncbi:MAG TPA: 2OG-Fe(II) oxygenase family protein, partial [Micropepsaceae bacterium]|nr:2OG-Fe(II) oxygenase family protein [Micropepsaceae bacterium]
MFQRIVQNSPGVPISEASPQLNPDLDSERLAQEYRRQGRIHIQTILTQASAERLYHCLRDETPYSLCFNSKDGVRALTDLTPQQKLECATAVWRQVGIDGFQFLYDMNMLSFKGEPYRNPQHYWAKAVAFLNSPEFLGFTRAITGMEGIAFADAQATLYRGGHFLTAHDDDVPGTKRLAAYVLSFTPMWRPEWGGLLEFPRGTSTIEEGYVPGFNTLKLFR